MAVQILASCQIDPGKVLVNDRLVFSSETDQASVFFVEAYQHLGISYPKFFKMDRLCQLAILGSEYLFGAIDVKFDEEELALYFVCGRSSLDSDLRHQALINEGGNVSPAVFVYTLPNILLGELAIKNRWYGENLLILEPDFSLENWLEEAGLLISSGKARFCLGGWVDVCGEEFQLKMYLVAPE